MSELLGADTRRVDIIAERLRGYSQDIENLRTIAQRAVAELRNGWGGPDFERVAQRWEQEAGPRLRDMSSALSTMAAALHAQAEGQRRASGSYERKKIGDLNASEVDAHLRTVSEKELNDGALKTRHGKLGPVETMTIDALHGNQTDTSSSVFINGHKAAIAESVIWGLNGELVNEPTAADHVTLNLARGDVGVEASLASLKGEGDNYAYELSAGKVEAKADYSGDVDAHGNLVASAGASVAAYAGYTAGRLTAGNDVARVTADGKVYVGAEVKADASGSIGPDGARGHLGAAAFAGGRTEANVGGTLAGVTATAGAEISFGIGAHVNADAALSATKVGVSADIGATLGIGTGVKFDVSVNPQEVIANVDHAIDDIGQSALDVGSGLTVAGDKVANFFDW